MKPNAKPTKDGTALDLNASAVLLVLADSVYGENSQDTSLEGSKRAAQALADLLGAATAGGYTQADILATLLTNGDTSKRVAAMCAEAMAAAGNERIGTVFAVMREAIRK